MKKRVATSPAGDALLHLPRQLLESARAGQDPGVVDAMERVCATLCRRLAVLIGPDGASLLMVRALHRARQDFPWLGGVVVERDGSLAGLPAAAEGKDEAGLLAGFTAALSHLLGLLVAFIGEGLTLHLIQNLWSDAASGGDIRVRMDRHDG